ncbi:hypothetical protein CUS_5434 [Ruminococcus albus 8]|uniref:Uncharacterized protein n=1 Tax=Ruminococcus albus 8 TaxID=246199 RepID=E9SE15_RUMAL|nr:hypothetical protein [Ruminococcus albus]EGC02480.1 hypothetical protein CUS_5434 [Ruminococcus albus 8]
MAKKNQPYSEIIDLQKELKEYKKLCRGKKSKFKYYLDWKEHITENLLKLDDNDKKENFLHYLINRKRGSGVAKSIYMPLILSVIALYVNNIVNTSTENKYGIAANVIALVIFILLIIFFVVKDSFGYHDDYCFYCDTIEILEEIMYGKKSHTPDPLTETL